MRKARPENKKVAIKVWGEVRKGFFENVAFRTAICISKCSMNMFKRDSE